jgi:NADPH:quinone reductase-like Zn-dependent oxidoreductase
LQGGERERWEREGEGERGEENVSNIISLRAITGIDIEKQHEILNKLADLVEKGVIPDRVTKVLSLKNEIGKGHELLESGKTIGKVVLTQDL